MTREQIRKEFADQYTAEKIQNISFEEYAIGSGRTDTFCYKLERGTQLALGSISGAPSTKFGVWYERETRNKKFTKKFGTNFENAFETVKSEIVKLINNCDEETVNASKFSNLVKGKILFIYHPEEFIPIYSEDYLRYFCNSLDMKTGDYNYFAMQKWLLSFRSQYSETRNMTNFEFYDWLYEMFPIQGIRDIEQLHEAQVNNLINSSCDDVIVLGDESRPRKEPLKINSKKVYLRSFKESQKAIKRAENQCEYCREHSSFSRKSDGNKYMEAHHLVPMSQNDKFDNDLDVLANIVSLCSECHNRIHYGRDANLLIKKLFDERIERLRSAGINITLKELYKIYGVKTR